MKGVLFGGTHKDLGAQNERATVTQVMGFGSNYPGTILVTFYFLEPQPFVYN